MIKNSKSVNRSLSLMFIVGILLSNFFKGQALGGLGVLLSLVAGIIQTVLFRRFVQQVRTAMSKEQVAEWESVRAKGKRHYMLKGVIITILSLVVMIIVLGLYYRAIKSYSGVFE